MSSGDAISFNLTDQFLDRHIREGRGQKVAIRCDESVYTYDVLAADVNRAGNGLLRLGLQDEHGYCYCCPTAPSLLLRISAS
jgi:acyl-coenzyme A synthetase/AMP-(fatty) acid ligase